MRIKGGRIARRHGRREKGGGKHVPFCGARVGELKFGNRVICWVWVERVVMGVIGVFKIYVKNRGEHDLKRRGGEERTGPTSNI